jgi:putative ABC transport system ATP-binding protein
VLQVRDALLSPGTGNTPGPRIAVPALTLEPGALVAVTGRSGLGKTTLLDFLALLMPARKLGAYRLGPEGPEGSAIRLTEAGQGVGARMRASAVAHVAQTGALLPFLDARENALMAIRAEGRRVTGADRDRLDRLARRLGIRDKLDARRKALSGGERKRIALLRALAARRHAVIADEPTTGLDAAAADAAMDTLTDTARRDGAVCVIATHDTARAQAHGFRRFALVAAEDGAVLEERPWAA